MKNVCYFNSVKFWGGGEKLHLEYAVEFQKKNYTVFLAVHKHSPLEHKGQQYGLHIFNISVGNLSFMNPFKYLKLIRFYRNKSIDTVIFSTSHDLKTGSIAAKWAGVKNIVYLRGLAVPIKNNFINRYIFKKVLTHIVPNSKETKRTIFKNLEKCIDSKKVKIIYHGIETEQFENEKTIPEVIKQNKKGIVLGNAGRLTRQKGQHHFIEIAKKLKNTGVEFTLFIAGTGDLYPSLEKSIKENNLENEIILAGFVDNIPAFMNSLDIFLLTSEWEGFGYVLVEAMACSKAVVAYNISSNPEIITNNETGYLIPFPDTTQFAGQIAVLAKSKSLRINMGEAGKQAVQKRFLLKDRITEFETFILKKY